MKLLHRITIAFGLLLLIVTVATAYFIHALLLDNLIEQQRKDLRQKGEWWVQQMQQAHRNVEQKDFDELSHLLVSNNKVEILLLGKRKKVNFSTLTPKEWGIWIKSIQSAKENRELRKGVLSIGNDDYVVVTLPFDTEQNERLILASPVRGLKEIRVELTKKIIAILIIGAICAYIISILITRSLVNPLTKLRKELKKVQKRNFSDVQLIPAEGEIAEVTRSVYYLAKELDHFHQVQKQFFQNASHELKTPLMSIQGYAEGIRDGIFTGEAAQQGLDVIVQETSRLKDIVTEMILLAKLESEEGIFHPTKASVPEIVQLALERLNPLMVKRGVQAVVKEKGTIPLASLDRDKCLQAFLNIMGNALRYAKETIEIEIGTESNYITIDIADDGAGIPQELLPNLFHRFVKGKDGETGLGLAISRAIMERSGGTIQAFNRENGGACFRIRLPFGDKCAS